MTGLFNKFAAATLLTLSLSAGTVLADHHNEPRYGDREGRDYRHTQEKRYDRDRGDKYDHRHKHDKTDVRVDINIGSAPRPRYHERRVRYWVEPEFKVVRERLWVEPVYKTVTERVWIEPVFKTVYEDVRFPARYEVREVSTYIGSVRITNRERVLVEPACVKRVPRHVCVSEGRWETIEKRICVTEGRWNFVEKQVCVSEGRWDYRVERVLDRRESETRVGFEF